MGREACSFSATRLSRAKVVPAVGQGSRACWHTPGRGPLFDALADALHRRLRQRGHGGGRVLRTTRARSQELNASSCHNLQEACVTEPKNHQQPLVNESCTLGHVKGTKLASKKPSIGACT